MYNWQLLYFTNHIKNPLLQACDFATRHCEACTENTFNDRNRVAKSCSSAEPWLGSLYDAFTRYNIQECGIIWLSVLTHLGRYFTQFILQ
jgi:hypothetical protein